jgi:hypothetical protein
VVALITSFHPTDRIGPTTPVTAVVSAETAETVT